LIIGEKLIGGHEKRARRLYHSLYHFYTHFGKRKLVPAKKAAQLWTALINNNCNNLYYIPVIILFDTHIPYISQMQSVHHDM
jgi:hypothetical protein